MTDPQPTPPPSRPTEEEREIWEEATRIAYRPHEIARVLFREARLERHYSTLEADNAVLRAALRAIGAEAVFEERFDVFAGWVRDVAASVLAGASVEEALGNADECAWAEEEVPEGWTEHTAKRAPR